MKNLTKISGSIGIALCLAFSYAAFAQTTPAQNDNSHPVIEKKHSGKIGADGCTPELYNLYMC